LLRPAGRFPAVELDQVAGCLPYKGKAKSVAEMNAAISSAAARRHDSGRY